NRLQPRQIAIRVCTDQRELFGIELEVARGTLFALSVKALRSMKRIIALKIDGAATDGLAASRHFRKEKIRVSLLHLLGKDSSRAASGLIIRHEKHIEQRLLEV